MEAFLVSTATIALAEIGDKTQLLAFVLASRYRRPWPIIAGILVATLVSHAIAGAIGTWLLRLIGPQALRWLLAASFFVMAVWILIPDRPAEREPRMSARLGIVGTTILAFFLAEMGDKTQIATMALAAKYASFYAVVAGTTTGMMLANVPAVLIGDRLAGRTPTRLVHAIAALIFAGLGVLVLFGSSGRLLDWLPAMRAPTAN
jgi:putative Ca2+/H+ antiporter (TMEM165/GDT1 family)